MGQLEQSYPSGSSENFLLAAHKDSSDVLLGLRKLAFDSNFFGLKVGRIDPFVISSDSIFVLDGYTSETELAYDVVDELKTLARKSGYEQLSLVVDCGDVNAWRVAHGSGFQMMDTIIVYRSDMQEVQFEPVDYTDFEFAPEEVEALAEISALCFGDTKYNVNRFNTEPVFVKKSPEFYAQWLRKSCLGEWADKVFVVRDNNSKIPLGFITCKAPQTMADGRRLATIPLNAVDPSAQGKGVYTKLVQVALNYFAKSGADIVEIRTQLPNTSVHNTWRRVGARLARAYHTFHSAY
jgi:GNAT superfamily N-acetyltransferase